MAAGSFVRVDCHLRPLLIFLALHCVVFHARLQMCVVVDPSSPSSLGYLKTAVDTLPDLVPCFVVNNPHAVCAPTVTAELKSMCDGLEVTTDLLSCVNLLAAVWWWCCCVCPFTLT